jgi:hypothetical protein
VHEGLSADPRTALDQLYERFVEVPEESRSDRQR